MLHHLRVVLNLKENSNDQPSHHSLDHRTHIRSHLVDPRPDAYPSTIQDGSLSDLWYHLYHCPTESLDWAYPRNVPKTLTRLCRVLERNEQWNGT